VWALTLSKPGHIPSNGHEAQTYPGQ
jgi:hypothetical protein